MIIRKPTKIELKPEQDHYEYEQYKKKQLEANRQNKIGMSHSKIIEDSSERSKASLLNEVYRTPNNLSSNLSFDRDDSRSGSSVPANQLFSTLLNNISSAGQQMDQE